MHGEVSMSDLTLLGPWVRRFLLEHLVAERNLARNTQCSYRDVLTLLIPFVADKLHRSVDRLTLVDVSADLVRLFLADLEQSRQCTIATRNQRLAAIHALARFVGEHSPEHIAWCAQLRTIPFKKTTSSVIPYLDKLEMDALLGAPDRQTAQGRRDHALLLFLYNSGARAQEAAQLLVSELDLTGCSVKIRGKGGKERQCPLWPGTVEELKTLIANRPMTATHLLRAGVDINTVRAWLGHVSLDTTNIYAEIDLEMKAKALARCEVSEANTPKRRWRDDPALMTFLRTL